MQPRRRKRHHTEVPDRSLHPLKYRVLQVRWRFALWSVVYPVQIAAAIAVVICITPVYMLIDQSQTLGRQQRVARQLVVAIQRNRLQTTKDICGQLDANTRTANEQLRLFQKIIVSGARQSRLFNGLYREIHGPSYRQRVRQATRTAADINRLRLPLPNCKKAIFNVRPVLK